jgi:pyruvate/2-oxoglutarate dehydrogenase complex dihydrolipoamide acyltransferase (E2) component
VPALDPIGAFDEHPYPIARTATLDTLRWGRTRVHIPLLVEVDVTAAREAIRRQKEATGEGVSFTGWIIKCLAQAVSEHPHVQALRQGRRKLIVFRDVDVTIVVERAVGTDGANKTLPMPYVIRGANAKSLDAIHAEIRGAQHAPVAAGDTQIGGGRTAALVPLFNRLPQFARDLIVWRRLMRDPFYLKRMMGTVGVTAIGMAGQGPGGHGSIGWGIPIGLHPLVVAVGGISPRALLLEGQLANREHLGLTILFDHAVTDGAPVARFMGRLQELMEAAYGLEYVVRSAPALAPDISLHEE